MFWFIAFALAWAITVPTALAQMGAIDRSPVPFGIGLLIGLAPAVAAAVATAREGRGRAFWPESLRLPRPGATALLALLLPPLCLVGAYALSLAGGAPVRIVLGPDLFVFGAIWLLLAFTEEVGWRGYALPRLVERNGFWAGSAILGLVWCVWHYPRIASSPFVGSVSELLPLAGLFSVQILISNMILCWIYFRSGRSVLAATLLHASFNVVATAYLFAALDLRVTGLLAIALGLLASIDPQPHKSAAARRQGASG